MPKVTEEYIEKKRKEIVEAAYKVCVHKPITSIEMKDIIEETGFSHGAIYRYYKDLDEVLKDLVITINSQNKIDDRLDVQIPAEEIIPENFNSAAALAALVKRLEDED